MHDPAQGAGSSPRVASPTPSATHGGEPLAQGEHSGTPPLEALVAHLREVVVTVDRSAYITAVLAGSTGALRPQSVGTRLFDHLHPDDLAELARFAVDGLATAPGWEGKVRARLRRDDGTWCLHEIHATNCLDDPVIAGFVLRLRELGAEVAGPPAATSSGVERELETLARAIPLPIMFLDREGATYFVNDAARDLCAHLLGPLGAEGLAGIVDSRDRPLVQEMLASLADVSGDRTLTFRLMPLRPGAEERMVDATFSARRPYDGIRGVVVTLVDVSAHHARESELQRMASCDPLTGLLNRTEIEDALAERLRSNPERVALLFCDLDGFKSVNDTFGHDVGDELLVAIAKILEAKTRPGDLVGRLGGDEFAVLVDSSDPNDAHGLACRIAVSIAELSAYRRLPVSASVGAATARRGDTTRDLLRRADTAMYDEKRRRRRDVDRSL